jgi:hypothetical protein
MMACSVSSGRASAPSVIETFRDSGLVFSAALILSDNLLVMEFENVLNPAAVMLVLSLT